MHLIRMYNILYSLHSFYTCSTYKMTKHAASPLQLRFQMEQPFITQKGLCITTMCNIRFGIFYVWEGGLVRAIFTVLQGTRFKGRGLIHAEKNRNGTTAEECISGNLAEYSRQAPLTKGGQSNRKLTLPPPPHHKETVTCPHALSRRKLTRQR